MSLIRCTVRADRIGNLTVTFPDHPGRSLFMQFDHEQMAFASACGLVGPEEEGYPGWTDCDPEDITECPDDYLAVADDEPADEVKGD
jgi:hypothetical protein